MGKKKKERYTVYNIDGDDETNAVYSDFTLPADEQKLRVSHDRKSRKGKSVTLITGFQGTESDLEDLARFLKSKCGVGGSVKEGEILIQGEWKDKIRTLLVEEGFTQTKTSGG